MASPDLAVVVLEKELLECVRKLCGYLPVRFYHTYDSRRCQVGFPDCVIVGIGGVLFRELKREKGRLTSDQEAWLSLLKQSGQDAGVWRPSDWMSGQIEKEIRKIAYGERGKEISEENPNRPGRGERY